VGKPVDDDDLISFIISGLNPIYNTFITVFSLAIRNCEMSFTDFNRNYLIMRFLLRIKTTKPQHMRLLSLPFIQIAQVTPTTSSSPPGSLTIHMDPPSNALLNIVSQTTHQMVMLATHQLGSEVAPHMGTEVAPHLGTKVAHLLDQQGPSLAVHYLCLHAHLAKFVVKSITGLLIATTVWIILIRVVFLPLNYPQWWLKQMQTMILKNDWLIVELTLM
jgi:hypothetical protein